MITCKRNKVVISGTLPETLAELTAIISAVKDRTAELTDENFARELIATAGRLAFANDEEVDRVAEETKEKLRETIERMVKG